MAGSLAVRLDGPGADAWLRAPAPLETQLREVGDGRHMEFWDGQTLIAEASAVDVVPDPIPFIDIERARIAGRGYPGAVPNPYETCFQLRPGAPRRARHRPGSGVRRVGRLRLAAARPGREGMDLVGSGLRHRLGLAAAGDRAGDRATDRGVLTDAPLDPADPYVVVAGRLESVGRRRISAAALFTAGGQRVAAVRGRGSKWPLLSPPARPSARPSVRRACPALRRATARTTPTASRRVWTPTRRTRSRVGSRHDPAAGVQVDGPVVRGDLSTPQRDPELAVAVGVEPAHRPCVPLPAQLLTVEDVLQGALGRVPQTAAVGCSAAAMATTEVSSTSIAWMSVARCCTLARRRTLGSSGTIRSVHCVPRAWATDMTAYACSSRAFCEVTMSSASCPLSRSS